MLSKKHVATLMEIVAVGSITVVGFSVGNPIVTEAIKAIGLNLASNILQTGASKLKQFWLSSENGILNHDIQKAFVRAFIEAANFLEEQYLQNEETISRNEKWEVEDLFRQMKEQSFDLFLGSAETQISEDDLKTCLYSEEKSAQEVVWQRIQPLVSAFSPSLQNFLRENLLKTVVFCFAEELKKDTEEGRRAWQAFQRLLLEGIKAEIETLSANQELIRQDLQKLDFIGRDVKLMNYHLQYRLIEPLTADVKIIKENVLEIREKVEKIHGLVEKINPPTVFDENQFRREYNEALNRVMFAASAYELNSVKHQIEYLEKKYPHHPDVYFLKDKFNRAYRYETVTATSINAAPGDYIHPTALPTTASDLRISQKNSFLSPRNIKIITASFVSLIGLLLVPLFLVIISQTRVYRPPGNQGGSSIILPILAILFLILVALFGVWLLFLTVKFLLPKWRLRRKESQKAVN